MLKLCVAVPELASVTLATKEDVPAVVGVPLRDPVLSRLTPEGSDPPETLHEYGEDPPLAERAAPYAAPVVPLGRVLVVIVKAELVEIVTDALSLTFGLATLVAVTVAPVDRDTVGAENKPELEIVPELADQVTAVLLVPVT